MKMGTAHSPRHTRFSNHLALNYCISCFYFQLAHMHVNGKDTNPVIYNYSVPAIVQLFGEHYFSCS